MKPYLIALTLLSALLYQIATLYPDTPRAAHAIETELANQ
jgi:hypothetical protein